ncbi:hypothetical protein Enr13x_77720 [Stieleria neptunia]|uniref:Uncharacterized protein n=1 Tax=Stieleria neptunia TaxID=2527979 RepID=A0A518I427_9BACT|nr:hypothetical protein Enr13x_77720 [Stieleria neptunia]
MGRKTLVAFVDAPSPIPRPRQERTTCSPLSTARFVKQTRLCRPRGPASLAKRRKNHQSSFPHSEGNSVKQSTRLIASKMCGVPCEMAWSVCKVTLLAGGSSAARGGRTVNRHAHFTLDERTHHSWRLERDCSHAAYSPMLMRPFSSASATAGDCSIFSYSSGVSS